MDRYREVDKGHGRIETRVCYVSRDLSGITGRKQWADLSGVAVLLREREDVISGKRSREMSYFILSDPSATARQVSAQIRAHWGIETTARPRSGRTGSDPKGSPSGRDCEAARNTARLRRFAAGLIKQSVGWGSARPTLSAARTRQRRERPTSAQEVQSEPGHDPTGARRADCVTRTSTCTESQGCRPFRSGRAEVAEVRPAVGARRPRCRRRERLAVSGVGCRAAGSGQRAAGGARRAG